MKKHYNPANPRLRLLFRSLLAWARITFSRLPGRKSKDVGLYGEDLARWELERQGYRIIDRRVRIRLGEIDIVARDGPVLVFVEVKTRTGTPLREPLGGRGSEEAKKAHSAR